MDGKLVVSLLDVMGRVTRANIEIEGLDAAALVANAATVTGLLDACSKLGVVKAAIQIPLSGVASAAAAGSNTDVGGKAKGISDDDGEGVNLRLPDPIDLAVNADGTIDLTETSLAAYIASFETGGIAMLSDGEQVATWRYGVLDAR